jgi:uncharacterized membrane protein YbaN (DUF454 family)
VANKLKKKLKKYFIITLGVLSILVGLAGLVLPVLQGWFFLAIGALLLSMYSPGLRAWIDRRAAPYPKFHAFIEKAEAWTTKVFGAPEVD